MLVAYNTKRDFIYLIPNRIGGSTLIDIAGNYQELKLYSSFGEIIEEFGIKMRGITIGITYRDPAVRYNSGLSHHAGQINPNQISSWKQFAVNEALRDGFHLNNPQCDHALWLPILLRSYNYNVRMMPLNRYSSHLLEFYPGCEDIINRNARKVSFNISSNIGTRLWQEFSTELGVLDGWKDWMATEQLIFSRLQKKGDLTEEESINLLSTIIDMGYFNDPNSPVYASFCDVHTNLLKHNGMYAHASTKELQANCCN